MMNRTQRVQKIQPRVGHDRLLSYKYDWLYRRIARIDKEWFPHSFRIERATQLATDYHFNTRELMEYFGRNTEKMANQYSLLDKSHLLNRMRAGR